MNKRLVHSWTFQVFLIATLYASTCYGQQDSSKEDNYYIFEHNGKRYNFSSGSRVTKWVDQADFRGTFDILWTCLVAIFISTYSMLCLNVPAPTDTFIRLVGRRLL